MPRPRQYDPERVLDAAVQTFWRRGYEATSIRTLVDASGLTTRSMYDAFGGKAQLFEAVLDRYHSQVLAPMLELLREGRGLGALRQFIDLLATKGTSDGCLFINTGVERNIIAKPALKRVEGYLRRLQALVREKLEQARAEGTFHGDPDAWAMQFCVTIVGFVISLKCGFEREEASTALYSMLREIETA